eukprot:1098723-Prymnesium_polylepis.1
MPPPPGARTVTRCCISGMKQEDAARLRIRYGARRAAVVDDAGHARPQRGAVLVEQCGPQTLAVVGHRVHDDLPRSGERARYLIALGVKARTRQRVGAQPARDAGDDFEVEVLKVERHLQAQDAERGSRVAEQQHRH